MRENSAVGLGMAFAGAGSRADDLSIVFNNPAGMTRFAGNGLQFSLAGVFPTADFHGAATQGGALISGNAGNNGGRMGAVPNFYGVYSVTDRLKLGLAITAPFGLTIKYNADWYGRSLGLDNAVLTGDINPNVAYKINDHVSIGGGISMQYLSAVLSDAFLQSSLFPGPDATTRFRGNDWGFGYNVGLLLEPNSATRIGLSYRSKVEHQVNGALTFANVNPALASTLTYQAARADASLPAASGISITHDVSPSFSISSDVQWTQWGVLQQVNVVSTTGAGVLGGSTLGFRDTWFASVGAAYRLDNAWTLRGGIGFDQSPVTDRYRTVRIPDTDRYMVGLGFGYGVSDKLTLDAAYAHYFAKRASMSNSINNTNPFNTPPGVPPVFLNGIYQLSLDYVALSLRLSF